MKYQRFHDEVLDALRHLGKPSLGLHMAKDRRSALSYVGIRVPALRQRVREGFSFYHQDPKTVLAIWDELWMNSEWGDVLFAAAEHYKPILRKRVEPAYWPVMKHWVKRVENWCHSDVLSGLYSRLLEAHPAHVMPELRCWNAHPALWPRRVSLVSLIHYTGKNAVFLGPDVVLPMIDNCVHDDRYYMQKAVGWVLREMWRVYPDEIQAYVEATMDRMPSGAFSRAIERRDRRERDELRALRRRAV